MMKKNHKAAILIILLLFDLQISFLGNAQTVNTGIFEDKTYEENAKIMLALAKQKQNISPKIALDYGLKAIKFSEKSNNEELFIQSLYQTALAYFIIGNIDSCKYYCNNILALPTTNQKTKALVNNYMCIANRKLGRYDDAINFGKIAIEEYNLLNDSIGMAEAKMSVAKVYRIIGEHKTSMDYYFDGLKLFEVVNDTLKQGQVLGSIANVYIDINQIDQAKIYIKKSINKLKFYNNDCLYGDALNNYGTIYYDEQDYDSALVYFKEAKQVYQRADKKDAIAVAFENTGITYVFLGKHKLGLYNLHKAYNMFDSLNLEDDKVYVLLDLGQAFTKMKEFDSANFYLNKALILSKAIHNTYGQKEAMRKLFELNNIADKHKLALNWFMKFVSFRDSIETVKMKENLQELEVKYQTVKNEKEIQALKSQQLIEKANNRFLALMIATIIVVSLLILFALLLKRKKDIQIHRQKLLVYEKDKVLAETEMVKRQLHEKQLENEIEFKTKQLASHALNMLQKNKMLQDITTRISDKMNSGGEIGEEGLQNIRRELQQGLNIDKDWDLFKLYFEQINESFFDELKKVNPMLTSNDYRLCALTKLNMTIKEMASVLNISANSLKNARYRLKKKLELTTNDSLQFFINSI